MRTLTQILFISLIGISGSLFCAGCYAQHGNPIDGKFVYVSTRAGNSRDVYVSKNGKVAQVAKKAFSPKWSPDGKMIVCAVAGRFNVKGKDGILLIDDKGKEKDFFQTIGVPTNICWGLSNGKVYFELDRNDNSIYSQGIFVLDIPTRKYEKVWSGNGDYSIIDMDISPDCKRIAYQIADEVAISILDISTKEIKRINRAGNGCWYPDSKHIAFITNLDENGQQINDAFGNIYKLNIETGEKTAVREVTDLMLLGLKVSRDGKYFYYTLQGNGGGQRIYISPIDNPKIQIAVTEPVRKPTGFSQDWSPDWYQGD